MNQQEMIDTIRDHQGCSRQQIASSRRFLDKCEEHEVPAELSDAIRESIDGQEEVLTRADVVLKKLSESESEKEEEKE